MVQVFSLVYVGQNPGVKCDMDKDPVACEQFFFLSRLGKLLPEVFHDLGGQHLFGETRIPPGLWFLKTFSFLH